MTRGTCGTIRVPAGGMGTATVGDGVCACTGAGSNQVVSRPMNRQKTPGVVSVALDALMRERGGSWIAHGAGSADRDVVDKRDRSRVPPDGPRYRLRRLWLTEEEERRYYGGFDRALKDGDSLDLFPPGR